MPHIRLSLSSYSLSFAVHVAALRIGSFICVHPICDDLTKTSFHSPLPRPRSKLSEGPSTFYIPANPTHLLDVYHTILCCSECMASSPLEAFPSNFSLDEEKLLRSAIKNLVGKWMCIISTCHVPLEGKTIQRPSVPCWVEEANAISNNIWEAFQVLQKALGHVIFY